MLAVTTFSADPAPPPLFALETGQLLGVGLGKLFAIAPFVGRPVYLAFVADTVNPSAVMVFDDGSAPAFSRNYTPSYAGAGVSSPFVALSSGIGDLGVGGSLSVTLSPATFTGLGTHGSGSLDYVITLGGVTASGIGELGVAGYALEYLDQVVAYGTGSVFLASSERTLTVAADTRFVVVPGSGTIAAASPTTNAQIVGQVAGPTTGGTVTPTPSPPVVVPTVSTATSFTYVRSSPATIWDIVHNLNRFPSVVVLDSSNQEVEGDLGYPSANEVTVTFSAPFAGTAYLN